MNSLCKSAETELIPLPNLSEPHEFPLQECRNGMNSVLRSNVWAADRRGDQCGRRPTDRITIIENGGIILIGDGSLGDGVGNFFADF